MKGLKFKSDGDKPFPEKLTDLVNLDFKKLDVLLRMHMRPSSKVEFIAQLKKNVYYWQKDGFKAGLTNFQTQYGYYQNFSEAIRQLFEWMSFSGEPEYDARYIPDVDSKEQCLVKTFKEMLPQQLAQHFFTLLPKPHPKKYWESFPQFLDAMNGVFHLQYSIFREHVVPFINLYHGPQETHAGGTLKTISAYMNDADMEPLNGDPMVIDVDLFDEMVRQIQDKDAKLSLLESEQNFLHALGGDPHKTQQKPENLPCFKTLFSKTGQCPDRANCKFSHDIALLKQKHKDLWTELKQSRFAALEDREET